MTMRLALFVVAVNEEFVIRGPRPLKSLFFVA